MARVGFDGLMISPSGKGHARSEINAIRALVARKEHDIVVFAREQVAIDGAEVVRVEPRLTIEWELFGMPAAASRLGLEVFVSLSDRLPLHGAPPVVTWLFESPVHRIRANRANGASVWHRASDILTSRMWRGSLRRAAHVAFGSMATRDEVVHEVALASTSVVYPGVPPGFSPGLPSGRGAYALHLGSNDPRDGTALAVEASRLAGVPLLVAGGWNGEGAEALGRVSDEELLDLYRGALVYVDPTRYEGFGYGALEAMASGAPVVASRVTAIPEVVGDAAILCEPDSVQAFADAIRLIADDQRQRSELRTRGLRRAATFTWERTGAGLSAAIEIARSGR